MRPVSLPPQSPPAAVRADGPSTRRLGALLGFWLLMCAAAGCISEPEQGADAGEVGAADAAGHRADGAVAQPGRGDAGRAVDGAPDADAPRLADASAQRDASALLDAALEDADAAVSAPLDAGGADAAAVDSAYAPIDAAVLVADDCEAACAGHVEARACLATCARIGAVFEAAPFEAWRGCMADLGRGAHPEPDAVRRCLAQLECGAVPELVGQQCDALGRCGAEGRGYYDEAACRADPYEETRVWACMPVARRERVARCLFESSCNDLQQCIDHAACDGEPACLGVVHTALAIDCPGICGAVWSQCYGEWTACLRDCREAARLLPPATLNVVEACANLPASQCGQGGVIRHCVQGLECMGGEGFGPLFGALRARADACNVPDLTSAGDLRAWQCLGEVHQARLRACLDDSVPCGEIEACLARAECGDNPGCMGFMAPMP